MPPAVATTVATTMPAAVMAGTMPAAVMAGTMTTTVMATTMTTVMTTVPHEDMAEAMTVMLNLDNFVLQGDRGGRQRGSETSGKAGDQNDGCGKRG